MKRLFHHVFFSLLLLSCQSLHAQEILENYIDSALKNNIVLQQKNISIEKASYALLSARSLFLPNIVLQGGYQTGEGGRSISFPVGDLLNPVYSTLNKLTASNKFPQVNNVENYLMPANFYDVKVNTSIALYNRDIQFNKQIQQQQMDLQKTDADAYKRELVKEVKTAYFTYMASLQSIRIYENAMALAMEGKKVNEKLLANGKGLPAYILRAESEIAQISTQITDAKKQSHAAAMYFNFLLNRGLEEKIDTNYTTDNVLSIAQPVNVTTHAREELQMLNGVVGINKTVLKMNKNFWNPKIYGFLNLGSQAHNWDFNKKSTYYITGLQLDMPLFNGKRNLYKIKQAELDIRQADNNKMQLEQQLSLKASMAKENLQSSIITLNASVKQLEAATSYQRLIDKGYKEGVNTYIETVDARNQQMNASLLENINRFKVLIASAELERENASYNIQTK
jgi:outer membrane protein TolC